MPERARLLRRAAATIKEYREEINYSETPANYTGNPEDIVFNLSEAAKVIEDFSDTEFAQTILEAIGVIEVAQILLEEKRQVERGARPQTNACDVGCNREPRSARFRVKLLPPNEAFEGGLTVALAPCSPFILSYLLFA